MKYQSIVDYAFSIRDAGDAIAFIVKVGTPLDTTSRWKGMTFPMSSTAEDIVTEMIRDQVSIEALRWLCEIEQRCAVVMKEAHHPPYPIPIDTVRTLCNRIIDECASQIRLEALEMATHDIDFLTGNKIDDTPLLK